MSTRTLDDAVYDAIVEKVNAREKFSAHDITKAVRAWVWADPKNNKITFAANAVIDSDTVSFIDHREVKAIVHAHMNTISGYTVVDNSTFWMYEPIP
jgi:hypothetical protein